MCVVWGGSRGVWLALCGAHEGGNGAPDGEGDAQDHNQKVDELAPPGDLVPVEGAGSACSVWWCARCKREGESHSPVQLEVAGAGENAGYGKGEESADEGHDPLHTENTHAHSNEQTKKGSRG